MQEQHHAAVFEYGRHDCFTLVKDSVEAVTGERIFADWPTYTNKFGAARVLKRVHFEDLGAAFASIFEKIPIAAASRGDIGVVEIDGEVSAGVFTYSGFTARGETQLIIIPRAQVKAAFKVT